MSRLPTLKPDTPLPSPLAARTPRLRPRKPGAARFTQHDVPDPVIGLPPEAADALVPPKILQGGEIVILLLKPSLWFVILSRLNWLIGMVAVAAVLIWIEVRFMLNWYELYHVTTLMMVGIAIVLTAQTLEWISRIYILTDRRIVRQMGFFRPQIFEAQLHQIQHTDLVFPLRERIFGLGSLSFSTAGTGVREAYWLTVNQPLDVHRKVVQTIHRYRGSADR